MDLEQLATGWRHLSWHSCFMPCSVGVQDCCHAFTMWINISSLHHMRGTCVSSHGRIRARSTLRVRKNAAMMLVILVWLKTLRSLQNGLQTHSEVTPLFSVRTGSQSSQSCHSVDADAWCKRALSVQFNASWLSCIMQFIWLSLVLPLSRHRFLLNEKPVINHYFWLKSEFCVF